MTTIDVPAIALNNGVEIPQLGFGVFQIEPEDTVEAVSQALDVGYRHIDTAQMYGNEREVGEAIAKSGIDPAEIFVTSKLNNGFHAYDDALKAFDGTLAALGKERIDLFLIHWPLPTIGDFTETWRALEKVYAEGRARSIGVSNFQVNHLERLRNQCTVLPVINQIELHPYLTQAELRGYGQEHSIATEAWSPIAQGGELLSDPTVTGIATALDRSPAQVVLRWHVQLGNIVFPKSTHRERMAENFAIFDFELSDDDMAAVSGMDRDERTGPDPDVFDYVPS